VNTIFLSVKYGRILWKYDNSRKRSEDAQIIFVFTFILFYHFRFWFFYNHFHLTLKVDKISKMILENKKLPFSSPYKTISKSTVIYYVLLSKIGGRPISFSDAMHFCYFRSLPWTIDFRGRMNKHNQWCS